MSTFSETDHPRGRASNAGQFRSVENTAPERALRSEVTWDVTTDLDRPGRAFTPEQVAEAADRYGLNAAERADFRNEVTSHGSPDTPIGTEAAFVSAVHAVMRRRVNEARFRELQALQDARRGILSSAQLLPEPPLRWGTRGTTAEPGSAEVVVYGSDGPAPFMLVCGPGGDRAIVGGVTYRDPAEIPDNHPCAKQLAWAFRRHDPEIEKARACANKTHAAIARRDEVLGGCLGL